MRLLLTLTIVAAAALTAIAPTRAGAGPREPILKEDLEAAIAVGRACKAPIIRIAAGHNTFDVFIESPLARIALLAATARQMHQPFDAAVAEQFVTDTYRVWVAYPRSDYFHRNLTINRITLAPPGKKPVMPTEVRTHTFALGPVPAHGIIEALRFRSNESTFARLPDGPFSVMIGTNAGVERYQVSDTARTARLMVCNEPRTRSASGRY
jgi:hypothetical protein